ncbi:hypothetical protein LCGC14_2767680, partial [marine sediment metagenome]
YKRNQLKWEIEIFTTIKEFWNTHSDAKVVLIDIPIGLIDGGPSPRSADVAARKYLGGKHSSSIFPTPCRAALLKSSYVEANQINREKTGKGLSKQTWNIMRKIKEVDILLQEDREARNVFCEAGPELCFMTLANKSFNHYKKTEEGLKNRLKLIMDYCNCDSSFYESALKKFYRKTVSKDDILDSWILAISASLKLRFLPEKYQYDSTGLPMRITIPIVT